MKNWKKHMASLVFLAFLAAAPALFFLLPKQAVSQNEKRALSRPPEWSADALLSGGLGRSLEDYAADHFPFRDAWVGLNAYTELLTGRNGARGVYRGRDGYLISAPEPLDETRLRRNLERFRDFGEKAGLPAILLPVPSAGYILEDKLPKSHLPYWDDRLFEIAAEEAGAMTLLDVREAFRASDGQLYYRTDHHLTSEGALLLYREFCLARGFRPEAFSATETSPGFYGTCYSRSGLWLTEPDTLEIRRASEPGDYLVTIREPGGERTSHSLYFPEHLEEPDQYPVFLDGNHSLVTIENRTCQNGRRLLLIKDSFAHCFATFAAEHYEAICMVDLRYYRGDLEALMEEYGLNELLYLYGTANLAATTDTAWLKEG